MTDAAARDEPVIKRDYPDRPIAAVGAIIWKGTEVLMIRRAKPPRENEWSIPGGAQHLGEPLETALHREAMEETGVTIEILGLITAVDGIFRDDQGQVRHHYTLIDYSARWLSGTPKAGSEEKEAAWVSPERLTGLNLWTPTREAIAKSWAVHGSTLP